MNEIFKKDITFKILSVLVAVMLWIYVYNVDVNPYATKSVTVPIKAVNENVLIDKDIKLDSTLPDSVEVKVKGRKQALDGLKENDIKAVVDYQKIKSIEDKTLAIDITCNKKGVSVDNQNNGYSVDLSLLRIKSNTFNIEIIPNITFKQGYKKLKISISPDTCRLDGDEAVIDSVDAVRATLDIKDIDRDVTKRVECKVYNKEGKEITKYFDKVYTTDVKIEVAKEVPVTLVVTGTPAKDYVQGVKSANPKTVLITGAPEVLAKINDLKTAPISIENLKQNLDTTGIIQLPEGVKLADSGSEISVSIAIDHLEIRNYSITKNDIFIENKDINSGLEYSIKTDNITIAAKGLEKDLADLHTESMNLKVDAQGLTEGTHKLLLNVELPSGVKLVEKVYVEVVVKKPAETASATSAG